MEAAWTRTSCDVLTHFGVDAQQGLSSGQAKKHAEIYGNNGQ
jgi:hypothetical protein